MKRYHVLTPPPPIASANAGSGLTKAFLLIVLAVVAVIAIRFWGESRMENRRAAQATTVATASMASATPVPTPTPQAPQVAQAETMTLDTGLGYSLDYELRTMADGVVLTDPDGDMWVCDALPAGLNDWRACKYAGTVQ